MRALDEAGIDAIDITRREATLDEVFLALTSERPTNAGGFGMSNTLLADSTIFARRNLEHIRQVPEKLTNVTIQPLMFVVLFAYVFGGAIDVGGAGYREYLIGGILIQTLAFAMMGPAMSVATDLQEGVDRPVPVAARRSDRRTSSVTTWPRCSDRSSLS